MMMFGIVFKSIFSNLRLIVVALAVGLSLGSCGACVVKGKFDDAARLKETEQALVATQNAVRRAIEQEQARRAIDDGVILAVESQRQQIQTVERTIIKEIPVYVEAEGDSGCNLTRGAVGLLNLARSAPGSEVRSASLADEEGRATSTVTQRAEVEAHADCATRYNRLMIEHNGLIKHIQKTNALSTKSN
jgi:hypothetical protein